jgi:hypothetical protein
MQAAGQMAALIEEARKQLGSPQVRVVDLHPAQDADAIVGHLMWDVRGRSLHFFAFDLTPPAPGNGLVAWFQTSVGQMLRAGELQVSSQGATSEVFDAPKGSDLVAIIVTEEADDSVTSPQGPQRITARFDGGINSGNSPDSE